MKALYILGVISLGLLAGCGDDDLEPKHTAKNLAKNLTIISDRNLQVEDVDNEPYQIISATPFHDGFEVVVQYGGGCEAHDFTILWNRDIAESYPPQTVMNLVHSTNQDLVCDALIMDTLKVMYSDLHEDVSIFNPMFIHLNNPSSNQAVTLDTRADTFNSEACVIEVKAVDIECGYGAFGSIYFETNEALEFTDRKVWLQPLINNSALDELENGTTYLLALKPIFGYEWPEDAPLCQVDIENLGALYPVQVSCITKKEG